MTSHNNHKPVILNQNRHAVTRACHAVTRTCHAELVSASLSKYDEILKQVPDDQMLKYRGFISPRPGFSLTGEILQRVLLLDQLTSH